MLFGGSSGDLGGADIHLAIVHGILESRAFSISRPRREGISLCLKMHGASHLCSSNRAPQLPKDGVVSKICDVSPYPLNLKNEHGICELNTCSI
jgi:hypothetical protein